MAEVFGCGQRYQDTQFNSCNCEGGQDTPIGYGYNCCGFVSGNKCLAEEPVQDQDTGSESDGEALEIVGEPVTQETLDSLNPLIQHSDLDQATIKDLSTPAGIINRALTFLFPIAGFILFLMIVVGGFEMMSGAANKKSIETGKQRVVAAIVGFIILFSAYWIAQLVEKILGVRILG